MAGETQTRRKTDRIRDDGTVGDRIDDLYDMLGSHIIGEEAIIKGIRDDINTRIKEIKDDNSKFKFGLSELITIGSVIVSLALAWGTIGTRVTVLEKDAEHVKASVKVTEEQQKKMDVRIRENESVMDKLWEKASKSSH